jgi:CubicO group peptidase (beta-lactamase class C family)
VAPAYRSPATVVTDATKDGVYGAHFWLNAVVAEKTGKKPYPDVPEDMFTAWGHWGQFIFIIPSLDLVVVRVGDDRDGSFDVNQFLKLVIAAFPTQNGGAR